jgi:hypothetical protein
MLRTGYVAGSSSGDEIYHGEPRPGASTSASTVTVLGALRPVAPPPGGAAAATVMDRQHAPGGSRLGGVPPPKWWVVAPQRSGVGAPALLQP